MLVECRCERVYRVVVRAGPVVFPDALGERLRLAPWDEIGRASCRERG